MEGGIELGSREAFIRYWLPAVVCAGLILVGTSLPRPPSPGIPGSDKVAHLLAYAALGVLLMRAFGAERRMPAVRSAFAAVLVGGLYGVMDELHQTLVPGRYCSGLDMAADGAGLVLGAVIVVLWWKRNRRRSGIAVAQGERQTMAEPVHVDQAAFEVEVLGSDVPVMVDFWAPWCGPCHMVAPTLEQLAADYDGKAKIAKVNVDNNPDLAMKYGIRSIPALLVFKGGEVVDMLIGVQPEDVLRQKLDALV